MSDWVDRRMVFFSIMVVVSGHIASRSRSVTRVAICGECRCSLFLHRKCVSAQRMKGTLLGEVNGSYVYQYNEKEDVVFFSRSEIVIEHSFVRRPRLF